MLSCLSRNLTGLAGGRQSGHERSRSLRLLIMSLMTLNVHRHPSRKVDERRSVLTEEGVPFSGASPKVTAGVDALTEELPLHCVSAEAEGGRKMFAGDLRSTTLQLRFAENRVIKRILGEAL